MDTLIHQATELANQPTTPVTPIEGRIAYVVSHGASYGSNGYAVRTQGIAQALNGHGFETLCFVRPGRPWELGRSKGSTRPEVTVKGVRYIHSRWSNDRSPISESEHLAASVERFIEMFRVYRPAVVLAASNYIVGLPAWIAAKRLGLPFYNEVRGFWELSRAAREPGFENTEAFLAEAERDSFVARQANVVYTLNQSMKDELVRRGVNSRKIGIIPNGISDIPDIKTANPELKQQLGIGRDEKVVGYIGSFNEYEGLDTLIAACGQLIEKGHKVKLLLVGDDQPLTQASKDCHLTGQKSWLIQTGRIEHDKVADYYALIDLVVIPRKPLAVCQLVPPMKALEALAYQRSLLVSDVAPLRELTGKSQRVRTFKAGDSAACSEAIEKALNSAVNSMVVDIESISFAKSISRIVDRDSRGLILPNNISIIEGAGISEEKADFKKASQLFYKKGNITTTLAILEHLASNGTKFDKSQRDFHAFVEGLYRLKGGWKLPPKQPNAGLLTRRKHLLYCLHQSVPHTTNGYSTRSHGIAKGLQQAGWKVNATTRTGFPWDANIKVAGKGYHQETVDGVTYTACAGWNLNKTPLDFYLAETADHFMREAQTSGAEIIVAASNHITALPALMAARRLGLPFVYEVRGLWEVTQASTQPEWADSERFQLMKELESQTAREADLVMTLTDELADELVARGVDRGRIVVVPNAVDTDRFSPREPDTEISRKLNLQPGVPVIGYAGSAVAYEGLELLLESLAELKKEGVAYHFVLVGDGKVIDTVKEKAKALNIEKECRFTGRVPFDQVPRYLSCMDIMPVPRLSSAVTEMVSPLKPLEAMAMAKAVVLSDVLPHRTFAADNERAQLFQKDNLSSLTETLKALIAGSEDRVRLGKAARAWVESERTWKKVSQNYSNAIDQLLLDSRKKEPASSGKPLSQITLGLIADQFTTDTLASAVKVVPLSPDNWQEELRQQKIDAIFVESAWKGNNGQWHRKVGYYSDEDFAPLQALLGYCREIGIPSMFWNKEDPVHFDRFRKAASLCDHVFTTDSRRIIPYLSTPGAYSLTASSCPFYASPKIHNLLPSTRPWQHTAAYGGTYYGNRYPERTEYMDKIMSAAAPLGLTIYDRQHSDPDSPYKYPGGLGGYVAGSLEYGEMIQAYKAHPVQINVNSVLDSPTMFSRRVIEAAACGATIISGPALGMNRYLEDNAFVIRTESDTAEALEHLLHYPAYRWRKALSGARAVMRAHTTEHRLTQMLRTVGLVMQAPSVPEITLMVDNLTESAAIALSKQTVIPATVYFNECEGSVVGYLDHVGIASRPISKNEEAEYLLIAKSSTVIEQLEPEDIEDLAWTLNYSPYAVSAFSREEEFISGWPGVAALDANIDDSFLLVNRRNFENNQESSNGKDLWKLGHELRQNDKLLLRKPKGNLAEKPNVHTNKTLLIAGHDLKFIKPFYSYFSKSGLRVLLDFWNGHAQHNETASLRLLQQANIIFCEWMLGNSIWYGKHKKTNQTLIGRLHAQEVRSNFFDKVPFEKFEKVIFVGPHILRQARKRNPILDKNGVVIYNGVDVEALQSVPRKETNGKVLGMVGIVPQSKRLDIALDILALLRKEDDGYILRIKGKKPEDYPWMNNRSDEMAWYKKQYCRIEEDPDLRGAVFFDPHGDDMPEWYSGINFALSVSDHESFHFTISDGLAAGCTPIVLPWEGAQEIYSEGIVIESIEKAAEVIKNNPSDYSIEKYDLVEKFSIANISSKIIYNMNGCVE